MLPIKKMSVSYNALLGEGNVEQLIIRLGAHADQAIDWAIWQTTEQTILASGVLPDAAALDTLQERAAGRPLTVLVPSTEVLLRSITLPPGASRKVIQSIGFMLEDDVALDIDEQFIALGPKVDNQQTLAIVADATMNQWLGWLSSASLHCQRMLPDILALPLPIAGEDTATSLASMQIREQLLVRSGSWAGWAGETTWLAPLLQQHIEQQGTSFSLTQFTQDDIFANNALVETQTAELELPMHILAQGIAPQASSGFAANPSFNLCQGKYQQKQQTSGHWQYWRSVAAVALIALSLGLVDKGLTIYDLQQQNEQLNTQIKQDIQKNFPNIGAYRDARRAITQYVNRLTDMGSGVSGVDMLNNLSNAFAASKVEAQSLKFNHDRSELRIQAQAKSFGDLQTFKNQAQAVGYTVEEGAINNRNNLVIGTLTIKG
jgi:general secretion pathway protein L